MSVVADAASKETRDANAVEIIESIRTGKWRQPVERIRSEFSRVMAETSDLKAAKRAVDPLKKKLPGVLWSGMFTSREKPAVEKLLTHSGLLCADLDNLGKHLADVRAKLAASPCLFALFTSPTGNGLKGVFRVTADSKKHTASFHAVAKHVHDLTGEAIDAACKDVARLCFASLDPDAYLNANAVELPPLPEEKKEPREKKTFTPTTPGIETRRSIAVKLIGTIAWSTELYGFCACPGQHLHTTGNGERDCEIHLDGAPTIHCFHDHCAGIREAVNRELRSLIGKSERGANQTRNGNVANEYLGDAESNSDEHNDAKKPARQSAATRLVKLADEFAFFHDPQTRAYVRLDVNGHVEVWPVNSTPFRNLLARTFYDRTGTAINRNALADAIATLAGRACYGSPEESVFLRVALHSENILIDLGDPKWRVVEVTPKSWRVLLKSPVPFVRTGAMRPLPEPGRHGSISPLWDLLNVTHNQRPLVAGALLNYLHPHGPFFVTNFVGEQGTAKSCAAKMLRLLIDPNETPLRSPPRTEQDLLVQAGSNWCVALDNLSALPPWLSDGLCRLSTGGGHSARSLFTDAEEFTLSVKRPVILNGIEDVAARPDLAERALQIELETIPDNRRISERELWSKFESARPVIFSAILDGVACALRELPNLNMRSLPRMADALEWATAGEVVFGWERGTFESAYSKNLNEGAIASVDAHPVGLAIRQLLADRPEWSGEPAQLLKALNECASEELKRARNWPENPRALSACLRRLAQALRRAGIDVAFARSKRRTIGLCKRGEFAS